MNLHDAGMMQSGRCLTHLLQYLNVALTTLKAKRQQALKVTRELRDLPPERRSKFKTHMMAYIIADTWPNASRHESVWTCQFQEHAPIELCNHAKAKYDSIVEHIIQQFEQN